MSTPGALIVGCLLATALLTANPIRAQQNKETITISGDVTRRLSLTIIDLEKMTPVHATVKGHDQVSHLYTGVAVYEVLAKAGVTLNTLLKGSNLAKYMLVKCADGYQVVFSLGEVDTTLLDRPVILAFLVDGKPIPLPTGPFRLIVPGEKKQSRSTYQVRELAIRSAREQD